MSSQHFPNDTLQLIHCVLDACTIQSLSSNLRPLNRLAHHNNYYHTQTQNIPLHFRLYTISKQHPGCAITVHLDRIHRSGSYRPSLRIQYKYIQRWLDRHQNLLLRISTNTIINISNYCRHVLCQDSNTGWM